jgi:FHA domain
MTSQTVIPQVVDALTERFDPIECLDERVRHQAAAERPLEPGRYLEVQGLDRTLMIAIEQDVMHVGRGLAADVRVDDNSVSRRHAILVPSPEGVRILDDRSSNGTFVNDRLITQADLGDGDVIRIGRVPMRFLEI